ncbi:MAG: maltotransferase domain-containing protein [Phenylobacterium sp.]|uniref:maltotransferase domain-containing protein n=1 Tax=Phenylobacterium sp. TaxID=1871053 RepID=UPI00391B770B
MTIATAYEGAPKEGAAPRIYYVHHRLVGGREGMERLLDHARDLGFDQVLVSPLFEPGADGGVFHPRDHERAQLWGETLGAPDAIAKIAEACRGRGLRLLMDLDVQRFDAEHALVAARPELFAYRRRGAGDGPVDPRRPGPPRGVALARLRDPAAASEFLDWFASQGRAWLAAGLGGFRVLRTDQAEPGFWRDLLSRLRAERPDLTAIADTPGMDRGAALALEGCGFDHLISSIAWWDTRARWLVEEHEDLRRVAPLIAAPEAPFGPRLAAQTDGDLSTAYRRALSVAVATSAGLLLPMGFERAARLALDPAAPPADGLAQACGHGLVDLDDEIRAANRLCGEVAQFDGEMRLLSGPGAPATALLRATGPDVRTAEGALLVLINPSLTEEAQVAPGEILPAAGGVFEPFRRLDGGGDPFAQLAPGEVRLLGARRGKPVVLPSRFAKQGAKNAGRAPRLVVEDIRPRVDGGVFAVKRVVGDWVSVEADVYGDGHEQLAAELRWRALDEPDWRTTRMEPLGNDRWRASFPLERLGRHQFTVEAWLDVYGGYRRDLSKKLEAGVAQAVDLDEGRQLIAAAAARTSGELQAALEARLAALAAASETDRAEVLLDAETAELMNRADERPFRLCYEPGQLVDAERLAARFASWYELFPRSQTDDPNRHGTFDDVIARLPAIRAMGFDVLYFPPIHPIGRKHRKGRNNTLTAEPGDPGSPYAIGAEEGGHEAIHPQLGTFEDFRRLVAAAREHGLEIALDFAIQCSPDHPWLKEHPDWFDWRPDGTIKYAENPPKKYQDIVNVDFYKDAAVPDLWLALRDIVLLWVKEGVRTFRVDNPHTKPFPFWEWMIREVRSAHPDVIFLSEAFTRPKVMYRLAKLGFSQSYTYFTWRHTKQEFTDYLTELTTTAPKEFFRPHFFVNTPDINPYFLQTSGRAGFLIRAALAATLSGLWGVYSGFELCEYEPLPGKEEYKDSEKFEIRPRDWNAPGNIIAEITRLNRLRKGHPALQSHLNVVFHASSNENVLYFAKPSPGGGDVILVAINLDPHGVHESEIELPLWTFGLPDDGALEVEDLVGDHRFVWRGKWQRVRLDPGQPYAIWRVQPQGRA